MEVRIRPYRIADHAAMIAMEAQVASYRPEDQPAVDAMYQRANKAKEADTGIWMPTPQLPNRTIAEEFNAFWVAEAENGDIVGMAGGQQFLLEEILPLTHSLAKRWQNREQVAELR